MWKETEIKREIERKRERELKIQRERESRAKPGSPTSILY